MPRRADLVTITSSTSTRHALPKLSVDEIFFKHDDSDDEPGDFSFVQHQPRHALRSQYVDRRIRHFLRAIPEALNTQTTLLMPYPAQIVIPKRPRAMLFTAQDGRATMSIRDPAQPEVELVEDDETGDTVDHSWDHLSKWVKMKDDNVLPLYGDSGSEGNYDSDLLDELEDEALDRKDQDTVSRYMPKEDVLELMAAYIDQRSAAWTRDKFPKVQSKAWSIWRKVKTADRSLTVVMMRSDLEHLENRLQTLKNHLSSEHYLNPAEVQGRCANLDTTIDGQMDLRFRIQVLTNPMPPERPQSAPRKIPKQQKKTEDDEESLGSDTDRGDLKDFIEKDVDDDRPLKVHSRSRPNTSISASNTMDSSVNKRTDNVSGEARSKTPARGAGNNNIIDLTSSSPTASRVEVPTFDDEDDGDKYDTSMVKMIFNSTDAMLAAEQYEISIWPMQIFKDYEDPLGLLMKVLLDLNVALRRSVYLRIQQSEDASILQNEVAAALRAVYKGAARMPGLSTDASRPAMMLAKLWLCWRHIDNKYIAMLPAPQDQIDFDPANFNFMTTRMKAMAFLRPLAIPADGQINNVQTGQSKASSNKTRKPRKSVRKDVAVASLHEAGRERLVAAAQAQQQLQTVPQHYGGAPDIAINPATGADQGYIYINKSIASRIKPHQIEGVRFMWREVVTADTSSAQGCLLAHTMGLGKTMQTITLLVTIAEAAASSDPGIVMQIPESIRFPRILLLCPAGIIENWREEWRAWKPQNTKNVGIVRDLLSLTQSLRVDEIDEWYRTGGVLLIGYEMFRSLLTRKKTKDINDEEHLRMKQYLLEGPNMVVADEAHKLKNQTTGVSLQASNFRTTGRLALTGSPMANNLQEYYSMISWVAPGYLGSPKHFADYYQVPIEIGLYGDSTDSEQRKSLKMLKALMKDIEPKVQRKDIAAVKNELKPKVEFVINIALTNLQLAAYKLFIQYIQHDNQNDAVVSKNTLDWLNILALLCDHPAPFLEKLQQRDERNGGVDADRAKRARSGSGQDEEDVDIRRLSLPEGLFPKEKALFASIPQPKHVRLSSKMSMILQIVLGSHRVGDKILIFSHWIPVLNYIQGMLGSVKDPVLRVGRLDGSTKLDTRQGITQDMNNGKYDVLLISTTAGGIGLNIYGANRVILVDFKYNPANEEQAVGRAYRLGQPKPVYVYHLLTAGTFEQPLHHITIFKRQLASRVLDHKNPRRAAQKNRAMLFEPKKVENEDLGHVRGIDAVLDEVLKSEIGANVTSITTTDSLHRDTDERLTEEEEREVEEIRANSRRLQGMAGQAQIAYSGIQG